MNKAIFRLMAGFRRFKQKHYQGDHAESSVYQRLASSGQTPRTLLIGCSDSRVDPAIMTDASPGELFVVRNVANLVPPCENKVGSFHGTSSAIEFAVLGLQVDNIIVLGHRQCGGIRALLRGPGPNAGTSFIGQWMSIADEARETVVANNPDADENTLWRLTEMESLRVSLKNIHTFPFVRDAIQSRQMTVLGIYFDLEKGQLWELDDPSGSYRQLDI